MVAFCCVVVYDVQNNLDVCGMQAANHRLKLMDRVHCAGAKMQVWRKIGKGVVPPVIAQMLFGERVVVDMVMDGHQFDGRYPQLPQVAYNRFRRQPCIGPPERFRDSWVSGRQALHVGFINNRFVPGVPRRRVILPVVARIDHLGKRRIGRVVTRIRNQVFLVMAEGIAIHGVVPTDGSGNLFRIRVCEELCRIETMPGSGIVRSINTIGIAPSRPRIGKINVPDPVGLLLHVDLFIGFLRILCVKQTELYGGCVMRKDRKVHPLAIPACTERIGTSGPGFHWMVPQYIGDAGPFRLKTFFFERGFNLSVQL